MVIWVLGRVENRLATKLTITVCEVIILLETLVFKTMYSRLMLICCLRAHYDYYFYL